MNQLFSEFINGSLLGLLFLIKYALLNFWTNYIADDIAKQKDIQKKNKLIMSVFLKCLGLSTFLTFAYYSSDGSYCVSQDMYGCTEKEYNDNFVPKTIKQAFEFFGIILTVTTVATYYRLKSKYLI